MVDVATLSVNGDGVWTHEQLEDEPTFLATWKLRTLHHARQEREPVKYLVDKLLPVPSLSIVYGGPGSLKSMLLADLCLCIAAGKRWLEPLKEGITVASFGTRKAKVLWIDFDNGKRRTDERFDAISKAHGLPIDTELIYVSMETPWLDASNLAMVQDLAKLVKLHGVEMVVIDNLGLITGKVDENSGEMAQVMGNLRWLCEECQAAVVIVHHQRKSAGSGDKGIRRGETLRGHSSIEAALDFAWVIERKEGEDSVAIIPTKVRGFKPHDIFGAQFTYEHVPGTVDLSLARFYGFEVRTAKERRVDEIAETIVEVLREDGPMNQSALKEAVRDKIAVAVGSAPATNIVRGVIKQMAKEKRIVESGHGTALVYRAL